MQTISFTLIGRNNNSLIQESITYNKCEVTLKENCIMSKFRSFALRRMSFKHIMETINARFIFILLQHILVGSLIAFPLVIQVSKATPETLTNLAFPKLSSSDTWVQELPKCAINDKKLNCENAESKNIQKENEHVFVNPASGWEKKVKPNDAYLAFHKRYMSVSSHGINVTVPYGSENFFNQTSGKKLLEQVAQAAKPQLILPAMQFLYPLSIVMNMIFIAIVSLFALPMNFRARVKLKYKQIFSVLSYAATIPALIAFAVGSFISAAFVYTIYNFGLIFLAYFLFRKYLR